MTDAPVLHAASSANTGARQPRVLMLCPQFRPIVGGYERAAERLSAALARSGCAVTVVTDRRDRRWPSTEVVDGFHIHRLFSWYRPGWHLLTSVLAHTVWLLRHGRGFHVWHVHQYGLHATVAVLLGRLLGRPVVLKLTSSGADGISLTLQSDRLARLQAWAHRRIDACVAVSTQTGLEARAFGIDARRIEQIPNGVDTAAYRPVTDAERRSMRVGLGLSRDECVAISVGRLAEEKNPQGLVQAWALALPRLSTPWRLVFLGDGPLRRACEHKARELGVSDSITFAGSSDRVPDWLGAADLFVLGSNHEGMANTVLEAMAFGLPSIVTDVSGMRDMMAGSRAGLVVPVRDAAAIADALVSLHDDAARRRDMGEQAREVAVRDFAIGHVAARHLALYRRLARG